MASCFLLLGMLAAACSFAFASDPGPLQDFCVADLDSSVRVNGFVCKDPNLVQADDFRFTGLNIEGNTSNPLGSMVTPVFAEQLRGSNTLGVAMARIDFAPMGVNPPHTHPRASEIFTVLEGRLQVGFVTTRPNFRLFTTVLKKGDVFAFPQGLVHFQKNIGCGNAVAIAAFNSQNPGINTIATAVFGSNPLIDSNILAKAFQVDECTIARLESQF